MNFIKKIADKNFDESVHLQFQKFSKGEFRNKAIIEAKKAANGKYTIKTSAEFANELVIFLAEKLGEEKTRVKGAIVSTLDLKDEIKFKNVKQFRGIKRYIIDFEMSGKEIINLINKFPKNFFALSFSVGDDVLKIKPKAPKSGKPGKGDKRPKADFCSLKTKNEKVAGSFIFEKPDFKEVSIHHTFLIEDLIIPKELEKTGDFKKMREEATRKGKIIRHSEIDGKEESKEFEFNA